MNIGILYIATGRYITFWEEFFKSAEKYFITEATKHYFVFTDSQNPIEGEDTKRVKRIYQQKLGWPYDTLMRFEIFLKAENELQQMDYIFFFNANMKFIAPVDKNFLPIEKGLLGVKHPGFYMKKRHSFTYETNPNSLAYMPENEGEYYFMGGLNGGKTNDYLKLIHTLDQRIKKDLENNIIALWHDESHLNRYLFENKDTVLVQPENYGVPEGNKKIVNPKIIIQNKNHYRFGGHQWLRGQTDVKITKQAWLWNQFKTICKNKISLILKKILPNPTNYVLLQAGLGNQLYMLSYAYYLKKQGFSNVKMIAFPHKNNKGDTKDRNKRSLLTELPIELGIELSYFAHKYILSALIRIQKIPLYKSIWSKIVNIQKEPQTEWAIYKIATPKIALWSYHIGYYQAHQYISEEFKQKVRTVIRTLVPNNPSYTITENDVAVHIRRGDFLTYGSEIYSKIEIPYYLKALEILKNNLKIENIYIFSDDFEAIKGDIQKINELYNIVLVEEQSVLEDFALLQQFSNFAIGNSTFAWWAAMLATAKNVIVPKKPWKFEMNNMSPYPKKWTQLENK